MTERTRDMTYEPSLEDWEKMMGEPYVGPIELSILPPLETPAIAEL